VKIDNIEAILQKDFSYYRKLPLYKQELFKERVLNFIESKSFEGRKELLLREEMKVLVAAAAIQLTMGFSNHYNYDHFDRIILFPQRYYSSHTGQMHTGEMNTGGVIVLSWIDFYEGIKTDNDSRNVGIHEFAHALDFMDKAYLGMDKYFSHTIEKIKVFGRHYIHKQPEKPFFRSYAATNSREFFAVGTEYFFEAPIEFRKEMPELYNLYCVAYRQSPQPPVVLSNKTFVNKNNQLVDNNKYTLNHFVSTFGLVVFVITQLLFWEVFISNQKLNQILNTQDIYPTLIMVAFLSIGLSLNFMFRQSILFTEHKIRVHFSLTSILLRALLFKENAFYRDIPIESVLEIYVQESDVLDEVTCSYLHTGKLKHATIKMNDLTNHNKLFQHFYNEYKIPYLVNGLSKKFEIK
jgi:Mlc titration factor MtfA (ptsG expression regulator)